MTLANDFPVNLMFKRVSTPFYVCTYLSHCFLIRHSPLMCMSVCMYVYCMYNVGYCMCGAARIYICGYGFACILPFPCPLKAEIMYKYKLNVIKACGF